MSEHGVVIAGGGPTGMMLAGELALAGVDAVVVERREAQDLAGSRSGGLHARTIEIFDQRGIADRFLSEEQIAQVTAFAGIPLDMSDFPTRHPYGLGLWQIHIERILAGWIDELGVKTLRGVEVTGFAQHDSGVDVELSDGRRLGAAYLVGCDGGRSLIRKAAGIEFPGWDPTTSSLIAEVEFAEEPAELGIHRDDLGIHALGRESYEIRHGEIVYADHGPIRVLLTEREVGDASEPTLEDLREALIAVYGTDFGAHSPTWISRFTDMTRQAAAYRAGRVLLAGDAAHIHPPDGGQGLQVGVGDAVNLGWKLAQVVRGTSPDGLLDTYQAERHPVAARVLRTTMAAIALRRGDDRTKALREAVTELLAMDEPRKRYAALLSGLDVHYDLGRGHPQVGRRMPDLELTTDEGSLRVFTLLHDARPVLLHLARADRLDLTTWPDSVRSVEAGYDGPWELPVIGKVPAPDAVLIRPDGHVAWAGERGAQGLGDALATWFGSSTDTPVEIRSVDADTPALQALEGSGLAFEIVRTEPARSAEESAEWQGIPVEHLLRTIVVRRGADDYVFVLVPGGKQIDWPKLRAHLGVSRISLPDQEEARAATGYERGAITPFGASQAWPVLADPSVSSLDRVAIGGGKRGVNLHVNGADLVRHLGVEVADVTRPAD